MSTSAGKRKVDDLEDDTPTEDNNKRCVRLSLVGDEQALTCADNRQKVDETDSENDEVESGNEGGDSDEIDEGQ